MPTGASSLPKSSTRPLWMLGGMLLIACNLRAAITVVAPVLHDIAASFALRTTILGVLTALPIFTFALASPLAAWLARRRGLDASFGIAIITLGAGLLLRSGGTLASLFVGSALIAIGIAIGNVLLPSLVKREFPQDRGAVTATYAVFIGTTAALGGAVAVPIAHELALGWQVALASPLLLAVPAAAFWLPRYHRGHPMHARDTSPLSPAFIRPLRQSALAWQVTLFMGLNSFIFFLLIGWMPAMLQEAGYRPHQAGALHGLMLLCGAFPAVVLIPLFRHLKDQRAMALGTSLGMLVSCWGIWQAPALATWWAALFGIAAGSGFVVALSFITLRTRTAAQAAQLSGMAQSLGYLMAGAGLLLTGWMRDIAEDWSGVLALAVVSCAAMAILGLAAGRHRYVE